MATLYILYGSATGNAEGIAKDLSEQQPRPSVFDKVICQPMDQFKKLLPEWAEEPTTRKHAVVLITSTTGNGDVPENASRFTRFLKRKSTVEVQPFRHVAFSVLGLGDTNYDQFCATGKMVDKKMAELGGSRVQPLVCADEGTGCLEETVEPWMETATNVLAEAIQEQGNVSQSATTATVAPDAAPTTTVNTTTNTESTTKEATETTAPTTTTATSTTATSSPAPTVATASTPPVPPSTSTSPLFILYGSATGNAESIAKDLAETYQILLKNPDSTTFFPEIICCEMNQFKKKLLPVIEQEPLPGTKHGVLLISSTTGNGDAPENADRFVRYLKRKPNVALQPFQHVAFSVLGLGDTNYDQFCATGKAIDKKMAELGGQRILDLVCADEGTGGLEEAVDPWTTKILTEITNVCRGSDTSAASSVPPMTKRIHEEEEKKMEVFEQEAPAITKKSMETSSATGVLALKQLLQCSVTTASQPLAPVAKSSLPQCAVHRSSCEVVSGTHSTTPAAPLDADEERYTLETPYAAKLLAARYLTQTCNKGATAVAAASESHCSILEDHFPLHGPDTKACDRNGKRVIELKLELPNDKSLTYQPGDAIGLVMSNPPTAVNFVLGLLEQHHGVSASTLVSVNCGAPMTVEEALRTQVDLTATIKNKRVLVSLADVATNQEEANALHCLAAKDDPTGDKAFQEFIVDQRRSFVDLLQDFPSCQGISLASIFSLLPSIPPRYYSICSSPLENTGDSSSLTIAFSVVDYLTPSLTLNGKEWGRRRIHGLATSFLEALCAPLLADDSTTTVATNLAVPIFPKPTDYFTLPEDTSTPMVLIGPGTGIAPFMGFLSHRKYQQAQAAASPSSIEVYFGCRHCSHDWLYESELQSFVSEGLVSNLYAAFSRDAPVTPKQYVQDIMCQDPEASQRLVQGILHEGACVYICGDGNKMAKDVQDTLATLLDKALGEDGNTGKAYLDTMKQEGRFKLDIWS